MKEDEPPLPHDQNVDSLTGLPAISPPAAVGETVGFVSSVKQAINN